MHNTSRIQNLKQYPPFKTLTPLLKHQPPFIQQPCLLFWGESCFFTFRFFTYGGGRRAVSTRLEDGRAASSAETSALCFAATPNPTTRRFASHSYTAHNPQHTAHRTAHSAHHSAHRTPHSAQHAARSTQHSTEHIAQHTAQHGTAQHTAQHTAPCTAPCIAHRIRASSWSTHGHANHMHSVPHMLTTYTEISQHTRKYMLNPCVQEAMPEKDNHYSSTARQYRKWNGKGERKEERATPFFKMAPKIVM